MIWIAETTGQAWAQQMIDLLVAAKNEAAGGTALPQERIAAYHEQFVALVAAGKAKNPERINPITADPSNSPTPPGSSNASSVVLHAIENI